MRGFIRGLGRFIWRFMVVFSFIVNIILVGVIIFLAFNLFVITRDIANPLVSGLHSSFVGLAEADIDWTIPVRDTLDVQFVVPLQTNTVVVLTEPVPLTASAQITLNNSTVTTPVSLTLPVGLRLPVRLDLEVPINQTIPVALDVRAVIPLEETQLYDVAQNLRLLFEPIAFSLNNLPQDWNSAFTMTSDLLGGSPPPNLVTDPTEYSANPWPGFSVTAGENYPFTFENQRLNTRNVGPVRDTGLVMRGGIQWLDMQLPDRSYLYLDDCNPEAYNVGAEECVTAQQAAQSMGMPPAPVAASPGTSETPGEETPLTESPPAVMTPMMFPSATPMPFPTSTSMSRDEAAPGG